MNTICRDTLWTTTILQHARTLKVCFAAAVVLTTIAGCSQDRSHQTRDSSSTSSEFAAPENTLLDLDGRPFELGANSPSPITVVVFTRTDCPVSNRFAPEIRRLYKLFHPRGVEFFLVYVDPAESPDAIRRHLSEYQYPCQGLRDPDHVLVARCKATITPEAVVLNKSHEVAYLGRINDLYEDLGNARSAATTHDLSDAIESTLAGKAVATPRTRAVGCTIADLKH